MAHDQAESLYDAFLRQVDAGGLFQELCPICHRRAVELTKAKLIILGDELVGRYTSNNIREFLLRHGRSNSEEAALLYDILRWQAETGK